MKAAEIESSAEKTRELFDSIDENASKLFENVEFHKEEIEVLTKSSEHIRTSIEKVSKGIDEKIDEMETKFSIEIEKAVESINKHYSNTNSNSVANMEELINNQIKIFRSEISDAIQNMRDS